MENIKKIDSSIISATIVDTKDADVLPVTDPPAYLPVLMHEKIPRPSELKGTTYKLKTPLSGHAMYVTINDVVLNQGSIYENTQPFEIFINSKNTEHFQWVLALTRVLSAVFRKGGDVTFLVEEMKAVFDPKGGYFKTGGKFMPSLVAEIGEIIEGHLSALGMLTKPELDGHQKQYIEEKKRSLSESQSNDDGFPKGALECTNCHQYAVVILDSCKTCLSCADSKCG